MYKGTWKIGHTRYGFHELKNRIPALCPVYSTAFNNPYSKVKYPKNGYPSDVILNMFPRAPPTYYGNRFDKTFSGSGSSYNSIFFPSGGFHGSSYGGGDFACFSGGGGFTGGDCGSGFSGGGDCGGGGGDCGGGW